MLSGNLLVMISKSDGFVIADKSNCSILLIHVIHPGFVLEIGQNPLTIKESSPKKRWSRLSFERKDNISPAVIEVLIIFS